MKKTTFGAVLAFLFAAAGALTAAALYVYHREKELDEYERLLFSDDYEDDDYDDEDSTTYENIPSAPAEEKENMILNASPAWEAVLPPQRGWAPT